MFCLYNQIRRVAGAGGLVTLMAGCSIGYQAESPEVLYSDKSSAAMQLQIPPDLTDISDGEQFVLPGKSAGPVTRNTLLPEFEGVLFKRNGEQSWLEISVSPEELWPQLLAFFRRDRLKITQTEPVNGLIVTSWQPADAGSKGSVLKNLIGGEDMFQRMAFRMERVDAGSTRLFARIQLAGQTLAQADGADRAEWPASAHNPEQTSLTLQRLLVFLGIEEQRAKGLLNDQSAAAVLDDATLKNTAAGTQLVVHRGYDLSFALLEEAIEAAGFIIEKKDIAIGEIQVSGPATDVTPAVNQITFKIDPVHISAATVTVQNEQGKPLDVLQENELLADLRDRLS